MKITCTDRLKDHFTKFSPHQFVKSQTQPNLFQNTYVIHNHTLNFSLFSCCGFQKAKPSCSKIITEIENSCSLSWKRKLGQSFLFYFSKFPGWALPGELLELA